MSKIAELIVFEPKKKAIAADVNSNFENLRVSNNEHEESIKNLFEKIDDIKSNPPCEINCIEEILVLNPETNNYKILGTSPIKKIIGVDSGMVFIEFLETRLLISSQNLKLQNNVDRICKPGDIGFYLFENGSVKEINFFTSKEIFTNSFKTQTILNAPKNNLGKTDFIKKIELSKDITPTMVDFENEICKVSASSQYDAVNYMPWKAFRHITSDTQGWLTLNGVNTGWLKIEFKETVPKVMAFSIRARNTADANTHAPCDFIFEGSNDDVNWTLLGDFSNRTNWLQNEIRYFALSFFDNFKFYRLTINKNSGGGTFCGFGSLELYEANNEFLPRTAKIDLSIENPLLINCGMGMSTSGKVNQMSVIAEPYEISSLSDNSISYIGFKKDNEGKFNPFITTAQPVYSYNLQRHSNNKSIPIMRSYTTNYTYDYGYTASASSFLTVTGAIYHAWLAFNGNLLEKWVASVVGNNQWLQIEFPNFIKAARFSITASNDVPAGCIKKGFIKGFNGEEWVILKEINDQTGWTSNQTRYFDADLIDDCNQFKLEIETIENPAVQAQLAEFQIYEVADCFVIPENKFYSYNIETDSFEENEIQYIGRICVKNGLITDVRNFAVESKYVSEEIPLAINSRYDFNHNLGVDFKNIKVFGWIKDNTNNFVLPWCVDSNIDSSHDVNNYGFYVNDCTFAVRTPPKLMQYKDYNGTNRTCTVNCSLFLQIERNF